MHCSACSDLGYGYGPYEIYTDDLQVRSIIPCPQCNADGTVFIDKEGRIVVKWNDQQVFTVEDDDDAGTLHID